MIRLMVAILLGVGLALSGVPTRAVGDDSQSDVGFDVDRAPAETSSDAEEDAGASPDPVPGEEKPFPNLGEVPERPETRSAEERKALSDGLIADQNRRSYSDEEISLQGEPTSPLAPPIPPTTETVVETVTETVSETVTTVPAPFAAGASVPGVSPTGSSASGAPTASALGAAPPFAGTPPPGSFASAPPYATTPVSVMSPPAPAAPVSPFPPPPPAIASAPPSAAPASSHGGPLMTARLSEEIANARPLPVPQNSAPLPSDDDPLVTVVVSSEGVVAYDDRPVFEPEQSPRPTLYDRAPAAAPAQIATARPVSSFGGPMPRGQSLKVATILFADGSAALGGRERQIIDQVVELYRQRGGNVRIVGHASQRTRSMDFDRHRMVNYEVSLERATSVANELERRGVPRERIVITALGDEEPVFYEVMETGEAGNRRAEIFIDY